jgi:hypothetical protein
VRLMVLAALTALTIAAGAVTQGAALMTQPAFEQIAGSKGDDARVGSESSLASSKGDKARPGSESSLAGSKGDMASAGRESS